MNLETLAKMMYTECHSHKKDRAIRVLYKALEVIYAQGLEDAKNIAIEEMKIAREQNEN